MKMLNVFYVHAYKSRAPVKVGWYLVFVGGSLGIMLVIHHLFENQMVWN